MEHNTALDKIARLFHDASVNNLSATDQDIVRILDKTGHGKIEEAWNWSRTKRVLYFTWAGA